MISSEALQSFNAEEHKHQPIEDDVGSEDDYFPGNVEDTESEHEMVKLESEDDAMSEDGSYYSAVEDTEPDHDTENEKTF